MPCSTWTWSFLLLSACLVLLPNPTETAGFFVGCNHGTFNPSETCGRMCALLGRAANMTMTSCCFGVNHAGRTACSCCKDIRRCPDNCADVCVMIHMSTSNCAGGNILEPLTKGDSPGMMFGNLLAQQGNSDLVYYSEPELYTVSRQGKRCLT